MMSAYAELQVTTNFSFLRGASHGEEFVLRAAELGLAALAVTDRNTLAGVVRAHIAAKRTGLPLIVGARLDLSDGSSLLALPQDRFAYGRLSRLISLGRRRAPKGECRLGVDDLADYGQGQIAIAVPPEREFDAPAFKRFLERVKSIYGERAFLAVHHLHRGDDAARIAYLDGLAMAARMPLVATNDVHYHAPERRPLQDVLTCIREHCTLDDAGFRLFANAERHLKSPAEMGRLFADYPEAVARSAEIAAQIRFSLDELRYEYPVDPSPPGLTPQDYLASLTWDGAALRYPAGAPEKVRRQIEHELALIGQLGYAPYFLTVYDIVREAKSRRILCQGRGSAANSAVCYCLGITAVDPARMDVLFERFVSAERKEPPDIDVDFEHERREEIIQYVYGKYGRERAGLAATVICYRARSAVREVGKALGLSLDTVDRLAKSIWGWHEDEDDDGPPLRETTFAPASGDGSLVATIGPLDPPAPAADRLRLTLELAQQLIGFPRHLSQHVGGFVITKSPLDDVVPIENAAMDDRTVVEWDKDDLDALGMLKIDLLGLGMLTCIRKSFELLERHYGRKLDLAAVPAEDPGVYDMLCQADSIGVFQVESRAQMSMLPRLKPRCFYDLVIEVAIVRPGPIQGDMVHPYLRRREGAEPVSFPSPELEQVLGKTLGIPLFQEQAMRIAIVAAGFTPSEADRLRRAMATFRHTGRIHEFHDKMVEGMAARGYERDFAQRCFKQIEGFGEYGFPESHAASFALLVYVSAWIKCRYPAVFAAALLNSQPMGFYAPAQIVRDARDHGVEVLGPDVNASEWDNALEPGRSGGFALRLGFRQIKGLAEAPMRELVTKRANGYPDPRTLWRRSGLKPKTLERLAEADAFASLGLTRRDALWAVRILGPAPLPLFAAAHEDEQANDPPATLPPMTLGEEIVEDYVTLKLSLKAHPLALFRPSLERQNITLSAALDAVANNRTVSVGGLAIVRQRPGTAKGVIFMTLEDEGGICNIIVWPKIFERFRPAVLGARLVLVHGTLQREGLVTHIVARRVVDLSPLLDTLAARDGPLKVPTARADEARQSNDRDPRDTGRQRRRDLLYPSRDFH